MGRYFPEDLSLPYWSLVPKEDRIYRDTGRFCTPRVGGYSSSFFRLDTSRLRPTPPPPYPLPLGGLDLSTLLFKYHRVQWFHPPVPCGNGFRESTESRGIPPERRVVQLFWGPP